MKKSKNLKKVILTVILALIIASAVAYVMIEKNSGEYVFETTTVSKGEVSNTITATGTLEATNTVVVGTQVSGVIEKIYVDFNSVVEKGDLLAELDKSTLQFSLENSEAEVSNAQAEFDYQESNYKRMQELYSKDLLSDSDYDLATFNYKKSEASLKSAKANLKRAEKNLAYAMIYSPINGVVQNCAVEEGQTVVSSMSTPELFTIVNDLTVMQVEANIDEADIGQVKQGQRVEFSVDAFPEDTFQGEISQVRLQPTEASNVITYPVIIKVDNPKLKLKPGLTASIVTYVEEASDILIVSSQATSFTPDQDLLRMYMVSLMKKQDSTNTRNDDNKTNTPQAPSKDGKDLDDSHKLVWVKNGDNIHPTIIEIGIEDGSNIEVVSGLEENREVLTSFTYTNTSSVKKSSNGSDGQKSPFVQSGQRGPGGGGGGPRN